MIEETIIVKGPHEKAKLKVIRDTVEFMERHNGGTCTVDLYLRDVGFLLKLLNRKENT